MDKIAAVFGVENLHGGFPDTKQSCLARIILVKEQEKRKNRLSSSTKFGNLTKKQHYALEFKFWEAVETDQSDRRRGVGSPGSRDRERKN